MTRARRAASTALAAVLLASACRGEAPRPSTPDSTVHTAPVADSVRLRPLVQQAVEARVAANDYWRDRRSEVAAHMWMRILPSEAVPGLSYAWGFFHPPNTSHVGPFAGVVGVLGDSTRILAGAADWAALVGAGWSPPGPREALAACAEVTAFSDDWPSLDYVYSDTSTALSEIIWPFESDEIGRRLSNPLVEYTAEGAWELDYWIVQPGRSTRYRCRIHPPATPPASRIELVPTDSVDVGLISV